MSSKIVLRFAIVLILVIALPVAIYLVQHSTFFRPKASEAQSKSAEYARIRSVTYHAAGITESKFPYDSLATDVPKLKAAGINTVFLVLPWNAFNSQPLATPPVYNDKSFTRLTQTLDIARANNMKVILPLNYLGQGWAPQGIDACTWIYNDQQYKAFETYTQEFLKRISNYSDMTYIMVFTEGTDGCGAVGDGQGVYTDPAAYAKQLQATLGSLPSRLPADLRKKFKIGYHDYSLINLDWGKGSTPIKDPNSFDFLSMAVYSLDGTSDTDIQTNLSQRVARFKKLYPETPLIIGETGAGSCQGNTEANQARVLGDISSFAVQNGIGINLWNWKPYDSQTCAGSDPSGLAMIHLDGTEKPAVVKIRSIFSPSLETNTHVEKSYSPWAVSLQGKNITANIRVQLFDKGAKWGNDIPTTLADDGKVFTFVLPANTPPSQCNVSQPCNVEVQVIDSFTGLSSGRILLALPASNEKITPKKITLTVAGVTTSYNPWAIYVLGTNVTSNLQVQLYDSGKKWNQPIPLTLAADGASFTFVLPANTPPSKCNTSKTCNIEIRLVDPSTKQEVAKINLSLPKK